jgi:hypothetical protein
LRCCFDKWLQKLRKTTESLSQDKLSPGQDWNLPPPPPAEPNLAAILAPESVGNMQLLCATLCCGRYETNLAVRSECSCTPIDSQTSRTPMYRLTITAWALKRHSPYRNLQCNMKLRDRKLPAVRKNMVLPSSRWMGKESGSGSVRINRCWPSSA